MPSSSFLVERLTRQHNRADFSCGEPALDQYLKRQARQDSSRNVGATCVFIDASSDTIAGYYTISNFSVHLEGLPPDVARGLPRYRLLPATLIGRLAIDVRYQGQGLGRALLVHALQRALAGSSSIASFLVLVDAKNDRA